MEWKRAVRDVRADVSDNHFKLEWGNFRAEHDAISVEALDHDNRVSFAHYRELVKPKDAERYWNLGKVGSSRNQKIVPIETRA